MSGTKITMTGADEAHYKKASKPVSRLIAFPDGISRHITLKHWHWEIFDRLQIEKGWSKTYLPEVAFQHATEFCTDPARFEDRLRRSFQKFIRLNMGYVMRSESPEDSSISNEDNLL